MKKIYLKPNAEYIAFYSDEDIAAVLPLDENIDVEVGGSMGTGPIPPGWDDI